ncbi:MAG: DUF1156 domain-containing protein [Thermoplasmata archaeon]
MTGIPKECRRLAEVDFPIARVSHEAVIEKAGPRGHPSMVHLWWARRPLASERALLMTLLLPDPCDPACPEGFKLKARKVLAKSLIELGLSDEALREGILQFVARFSDWERGNDPIYVECARELVKAAHGSDAPLVVDPFAGGGSIPLEALRVGCDAFASDLNPVACLLMRVLLEDFPHDGQRLANELRAQGEKIQTNLQNELGRLYPPDPDGRTPIAYLWARTVRCESPNCGAEIPLTRSHWLSRKQGHKVALRARVARQSGLPPTVSFEIFTPVKDEEVPIGTVSRATARCLACDAALPAQRVRDQLRDQRGGANPLLDSDGLRIGGSTLLAVVTAKKGIPGRRFRLPIPRDLEAVAAAQVIMEQLAKKRLPNGMSLVPDEPTPKGGGRGAGRAFAMHQYGISQWADLFTTRQKVAILALQGCAIEAAHRAQFPQVIPELLAVAVDRVVMSNVSLTNWNSFAEKMQHGFGLQVLRVVWDFAEVVPTADAPGNWRSGYELVANAAEKTIGSVSMSQVQVADACHHPLPDESAAVWFTDPPYYDAVPYSDLSDFFYVWLRRMLPDHPLLRDPFDPSNRLTPKTQEVVQDETRISEGRPKDKTYFESAMSKAFAEGRRILRPDGVGCVVFAHKTTEGWEALLSGLVKNGWVITGSWPLVTEMETRLRARKSAALATSIHLVCRPRAPGAPVGDWSEVVKELPLKVSGWMDRLTGEGVRGADLVFACIGPAMEVYSRYSRVVDAQDREIPLGGDAAASDPHVQGYLAKVWEVVGRIALEQVLGSPKGGSNALEEDARLTALFLWAMQSTTEEVDDVPMGGGADESEPDENEHFEIKDSGGYALVYDVVRRFAQPLGIHLDTWEGRIIETEGGIVRLLAPSERIPQLFEEEDVQKLALEPDESSRSRQMTLFPDQEHSPPEKDGPTPKGRGGARAGVVRAVSEPRRRTTLDRLHTAMLLQAHGASVPLRTLLKAEKKHGPEFERLARSMTALYPQGSEERRLLEALALVIPN